MAYFAKLNGSNIVLAIHIVENEILENVNGDEVDQNGIDHLNSLFGFHPKWVRAYKGGGQRVNFPDEGYSYNASLDAFLPPKPFESWTLDAANKRWVPPVSEPSGEEIRYWDEDNQQWTQIT